MVTYFFGVLMAWVVMVCLAFYVYRKEREFHLTVGELLFFILAGFLSWGAVAIQIIGICIEIKEEAILPWWNKHSDFFDKTVIDCREDE